ncbi:MAG: glyoxalase [Lachnospiraceae bacterium]|nr:glyoxalase [Lachnospiraceae bacterium]MBQ2576395.1 glyoxalase [Lachnospiraceae bacterium]MCR4733356.1 glyoxalase [Lachnospiraceae bacterium]MEE3355629.1 glyoxalase [Candidatus Weimeria sp.]
MDTYDSAVIAAFLEQQEKLFSEPVAESEEEAECFLEDVCAVVCRDRKEAIEYMKDNLDTTGMSEEEILSCEEVFGVEDGRYLIVEG